MKPFSKLIALIAASCIAFLGTARAQLVTYQTLTTWSGSAITFDSGITMGETFNNILAVSSITYTFVTASTPSAAGTLSAAFGQWKVDPEHPNGAFVGTPFDFGIISIPSSSSWTDSVTRGSTVYPIYNAVFSFGSFYLTDPTKTYALMLTNTGADSSFALGLNNSNPFTYGQSYDGDGGYSNKDYAFSQIVLVPNDGHVVPVPEASTTAAFAGCGLVGILAALRRRQKQHKVAA
ncbi:MAG: hypothetical protein WC378_16795 [Opitutaceae bacterium]|jgi:hypothetical protein